MKSEKREREGAESLNGERGVERWFASPRACSHELGVVGEQFAAPIVVLRLLEGIGVPRDRCVQPFAFQRVITRNHNDRPTSFLPTLFRFVRNHRANYLEKLCNVSSR